MLDHVGGICVYVWKERSVCMYVYVCTHQSEAVPMFSLPPLRRAQYPCCLRKPLASLHVAPSHYASFFTCIMVSEVLVSFYA